MIICYKSSTNEIQINERLLFPWKLHRHPLKKVRDKIIFFPNFLNSLLDILERLGHFLALSFREEECEEARGDRHDGEDEGRYDGVDIGQRGHSGGQGPAQLK